MANHTELRVHGVSGTPPRDMLHTGPVTYDQSRRLARVYERSKDRFDVKAFHWGSLTAGRSVTALWILLSPFALANVAGWMTERANAWTRAFGRLAGIALTSLFFVQISHMGLGIPYDALARGPDGPSSIQVMWIFIALSVTVTVGLLLLATQSHFRSYTFAEKLQLVFWPTPLKMLPPEYWDTTPPFAQWTDPARGASLVGSAMWQTQGLLHRLTRLHLSAGMVALSLVVAYGLDSGGLEVAAKVAIGALAAVTLLTTWAPTSPITRWSTAIAPLASAGLLGWVAAEIANAELTAESLSSSGELTFTVAVALGASAALSLVGEWVAHFREHGIRSVGRGWSAVGLLALAAFVGASLGLTGALLVEDWTGGAPGGESVILEMGGAWTSLAMLGLVVVLAVLAIWLTRRPLSGNETMPGADEVARESSIRRVILRAPLLLGSVGAYALAIGVVAWATACEPPARCDVTRLPDWDVMWQETWDVELLGLSFDLGALTGWTKLLMLVGPAFLIFRSIIGGLLRGQDSRRQVSILWDLGSFWPRWHHPLGPPAYSPNAVRRLTEEFTIRKSEVLGAHSQGSLITAVAISRLADDVPAPRLLTYGSQLGILYQTLFPSVGLGRLIEAVEKRVDGRWINLWRRSDPIGGQLVAKLQNANWHVNTGSGHSYYELTPEYCQARLSLLSGDLHRPDDPSMADCWDRS